MILSEPEDAQYPPNFLHQTLIQQISWLLFSTTRVSGVLLVTRNPMQSFSTILTI